MPKTNSDHDDTFDASPEAIAEHVLGSNAQSELRAIIDSIELLEKDKQDIADGIKEVKSAAKGKGFDVKTINKVLKIRKMDRAKRQEEQDLLDQYLLATGDLD